MLGTDHSITRRNACTAFALIAMNPNVVLGALAIAALLAGLAAALVLLPPIGACMWIWRLVNGKRDHGQQTTDSMALEWLRAKTNTR